MSKFSFLKISPPLVVSELDAKIKDLKERKEKYITEGESKLKDEKDNIDDIDFDKL